MAVDSLGWAIRIADCEVALAELREQMDACSLGDVPAYQDRWVDLSARLSSAVDAYRYPSHRHLYDDYWEDQPA